MKAIWINVVDRTITEVEYTGGLDLQRMVGGSICLAGCTLQGDTVYVNDEGLYKFDRFFDFPQCGQGLFAGNGVIVGKEIGQTANTRPYRVTLQQVQDAVSFLTREEARFVAHQRGL